VDETNEFMPYAPHPAFATCAGLRPCDVSAVRAARDAADLRSACEGLIAGSPHVALRPDRLDGLLDAVRAARPLAWDWVFDPRSRTDADRLFDAAFNASLNGGYFFQSFHSMFRDADGAWKPNDGLVHQWQVDGSGSRALTEWIGRLRGMGLVPGHDFSGGGEAVERCLLEVYDTMVGQPYIDERIAALLEAVDPARRRALLDLAREVFADGGMLVELRHADRLADIYPAALRADPFRKKAILAFLLVAGGRAASGLPVTWRCAAPMDYQLGRILAWKGVVELSAEFLGLLRAPDVLLPIGSAFVHHLRAATLVAVEELSARSGVPAFLVDGALFLGFRENPAFLAEAPPPMRVDGTWF